MKIKISEDVIIPVELIREEGESQVTFADFLGVTGSTIGWIADILAYRQLLTAGGPEPPVPLPPLELKTANRRKNYRNKKNMKEYKNQEYMDYQNNNNLIDILKNNNNEIFIPETKNDLIIYLLLIIIASLNQEN